ncbi:MAG: DNA polymerase III subunit delta [Fluviicola sp.]|nr:DNA polymerase III subunit delta [Fluviicola sp.]
MDYKGILQNIKAKNFEKIYFLHGEEAYYIDKITDAIIENALEEHERDFNQSIIYGKDADALSIISEAKGYPMMANRRLVVLKEAQYFSKKMEDLLPYFEDPSEQTIFVINYKYGKYDSRKKAIKAAAKNGLVYRSDKVPEYKLVDWINNYIKSKGYSISSKACMLLAEFLGDDLSKITNEVDKLEILVEKGTTINEVHIEENIGISKDYNVFELGNAIGVRDVLKANKIVDYFVHNPKAGPMVMVVANLFTLHSQMMKVHFSKNKSKDAIAKSLRMHPFVAGKILSACKIYNPKKIAANIAILHEYDLKSKGVDNPSTTPGELMKELIFKLMH